MKILIMHDVRGVAAKNESDSGSCKPRRWASMAKTKSNALLAATSWALNPDQIGFDGDSSMKDTNSIVEFQQYSARSFISQLLAHCLDGRWV